LPAQPRAKTVQDYIDELPMWVRRNFAQRAADFAPTNGRSTPSANKLERNFVPENVSDRLDQDARNAI
jgi:hypothetical protein